ncbi:MAG: hypothetical protein OXK79_05130 [Chloroflexota bacterium]|nr:hypothetical protein [Chloroflexota bacterium]
MRPGRNFLDVMILRILAGSLAAVVLGGLLACGQSEETHGVNPIPVTRPMPEQFDLLESAFHQSNIRVTVGERVEVSVEVRQEKHDEHICGVPSVIDPFGNVLLVLTPRQNATKGTASHYVYESQYAFLAAAYGEYGVRLENRGCLLDDVPAVATVQWTVFPVQE